MAGFPGLDELFEGRHFDPEIIVLCVRWYLRFKLSFRDLVEMMAERGCRWLIPPSCVGCIIMFLSSNAAGTGSHAGRSLAACRRNLREDPRQVGLFVPGGRS